MLNKSLKIKTLKGGSSLLIEADAHEPVVSLQAWIKAGSVYEYPSEYGRVHLLEHMLFQAAEVQYQRSPATAIEAVGGHLNAFTSPDEMVVHTSLPAAHWKTGLETLIQLLFPSTFPKEELEKEKEVVLEEIKREQDAPDRLLFRELLLKAYGEHPYARPVLGDPEIVQQTTSDDLKNLHRRLFQQDRISFSVVGAIDEQEVSTYLEQLLPQPYKAQPIKNALSAEHQGFQVSITEKELFEHRLAIAWPIPLITADEAPGLEMLCMLWGQGASAPLEKKLRWDRQMVNDVNVSLFQPARGGLAVLSFFGLHESLHSVLAQTHETLHRLIKKGPSDEELEKARAWIEAAQAYRGETVQGRAHLYGESFLRYQSPHLFETFFDRLLNVTKEEVQQLALRFIGHKNATLIAHVPQGQGTEFEQLEQLWQEVWSPPLAVTLPPTTPPKKVQPLHASPLQTDQNSLPIAKKLWGHLPIVYQATSKIPAIHLYAAWNSGQTYEPFEQSGIGTLTSEMITLATQHLDRDQYAAAVDLQTTHFSSYFGRNSAGLHFGCVKNRFGEALSLFKQTVLAPHFLNEYFEKTVSLLEKDLTRRFDYPTNLAVELFHKTLWDPQHPYGRLASGTPTMLAQRNIDEIHHRHQSVFLEQQPVLSLVGNFDIETTHAFLEEELLPFNHAPKHHGNIIVPERHQESRFAFYPFEGEQTHIILGFEGLTLLDPQRDALLLLMACLAGQSGLLFQELREKHSLCYQVQGFHFEGLLPGACGFYIGCAHNKVHRAIQQLESLIHRLCHHELPHHDIERAKNLLIGQQQIAQQRIQNRALGFCINTLFGKEYDAHLKLAQRLQQISAGDLQDVAQSLFKDQKRALVVVGEKHDAIGTPDIDGKKLVMS